MPLARHLVIFVKAARLGAVKTRLAEGMGDVAATRFYRNTTKQLLRRVAEDRRWKTWLAVAPDRFAGSAGARLWPNGIARLLQGRGDLGARMGRVFRTLPPGPAVIVGSDIPGVTAAHIEAAFRALGHNGAVFGPSRDGGYWLIGLKRRPRIPDPFQNVRWSSKHALADTLANLGDGAHVAYLETLRDIDTVEDFEAWRVSTVN